MTITLYMQIFSPPVRSVLLTAEALGLKLQQKLLDLSKQEHLTPEFCKLNPQHTIPTLDDNGTLIWDSHAINAYLVGKYGKNDSLYPKDLKKRAVVDQRLHFDSGAVFPWLRNISRGVKYKERTELTEDQVENLQDAFQHLENFLNGEQWVAGDKLTIADFSLITNITTIDIVFPVDTVKYPNIAKWMRRCEDLPYYAVNKPGLENFKAMMKPLLH